MTAATACDGPATRRARDAAITNRLISRPPVSCNEIERYQLVRGGIREAFPDAVPRLGLVRDARAPGGDEAIRAHAGLVVRGAPVSGGEVLHIEAGKGAVEVEADAAPETGVREEGS